MKKIVFSIPEFGIGGTEIALCELLHAISKLNKYELSVITFKPVIERRFLDVFNQNKIKLYEAPTFSLKPKYLPEFIQKQIGKKNTANLFNQFDIIIDFKYTYSSKYYKKLNKTKICWLHCGYNYFKRHLDPAVLARYDKVVCVSKSIVNDIDNEVPQLRSKTATIYNAIDPERVRQLSTQSSNAAEGKYFVAVQRLDPWEKDIPTLIKGFNIFAKSHPDYKLYIVGGGDKEYKDYLRSLCDNDQIIFTGSQSNPYGMIRNAEALILSSTSEVGEGLPLVLIEAHALETLCISSEVKSGPPEILINGDAGFLFEAGNPDSLAQMLETAVNNPELCQAKINCASANLDRFIPESVAEQFVQVIDSIA